MPEVVVSESAKCFVPQIFKQFCFDLEKKNMLQHLITPSLPTRNVSTETFVQPSLLIMEILIPHGMKTLRGSRLFLTQRDMNVRESRLLNFFTFHAGSPAAFTSVAHLGFTSGKVYHPRDQQAVELRPSYFISQSSSSRQKIQFSSI
jgi:hypothetical protein